VRPRAFPSLSRSSSRWCFRSPLVAIAVGKDIRMHIVDRHAASPTAATATCLCMSRSALQSKGSRRNSRCDRFAPPETRILPAHKLSGYLKPCPIKRLPVLAFLHSLLHYAPTPFSDLPIRSAHVPKTYTCYANPSILREWREVLCRRPTWDLVQAQPCLAPT
jgi:hypothetical protein